MNSATTSRTRATPRLAPPPPRGSRLVSAQLRQAFGRRVAETAGLGLGVLAVALLVALLSYNAHDSSLNTAAAGPVANLAGAGGAIVADLLIQLFGAASVLPALTMLAWAWRIAAHRGLGHVGVRLLSLVAGAAFLAAACACLSLPPAMAAWPSLAGPGGAAGAGIAGPLLLVTRDLLADWGPAAAGSVTALIGAAFAWCGFGLSLGEWRAAGRGAALAARVSASGVGRFSLMLRRLGRTRIVAPLEAQFEDRDPPVAQPPGEHVLHRAPAKIPAEPAAPAAKQVVVKSRIIPPTRKAAAPQQETLDLQEPGWVFPSLSLLRSPPARANSGPSEEALQANARLLESVLSDYGVQGTIRDIHPGPVVTLYELEPAPGIRSARVIGLADDVARSLCVTAVRIATVSGRNVIGIEVPNAKRETVYLSELIGAEAFGRQPGRLLLALGKDIGGVPQIADLARMPHLLIAGTTGSGKSVGINAMILSLLYRLSPDQCRMILIDPKMLELSVYEGIPHLMAPVVTEPAKAVSALKWTVREMERRYRAMSGLSVRNIGGYNDRVAEARAKGEVVTRRVQTGFDPETNRPIFEEQAIKLETLPFIVVVIDEMADLMMVAGKEIEAAVQRLAQMARAAGIHVIMATQRPSVDVITGTIKANFPTRISFQVISKFDSRTILGEQGAEQLLGMGDMLHMVGGGRITRVHGPFVTDREVEDVVAFLRSQGDPAYLDEVTEPQDDDASPVPMLGLTMPNDGEIGLFDQAVAVVAREGKASTSFIQRHLNIGYNRAAKLIEQMEKEGIITPANHVGRREILVRRTNED